MSFVDSAHSLPSGDALAAAVFADITSKGAFIGPPFRSEQPCSPPADDSLIRVFLCYAVGALVADNCLASPKEFWGFTSLVWTVGLS